MIERTCALSSSAIKSVQCTIFVLENLILTTRKVKSTMIHLKHLIWFDFNQKQLLSNAINATCFRASIRFIGFISSFEWKKHLKFLLKVLVSRIYEIAFALRTKSFSQKIEHGKKWWYWHGLIYKNCHEWIKFIDYTVRTFFQSFCSLAVL